MWLPFDTKTYATDWSATPFHELYAHSTDTGADFDAMDVTNVAYSSDNSALVASYFNETRHFFRDVAPPVPGNGTSPNSAECTAKGGIMWPRPGSTACCPASCGECGGSDCGTRPGGKASCCGNDVQSNGRKCVTDPPPCNV